jgi:hypothetical protein
MKNYNEYYYQLLLNKKLYENSLNADKKQQIKRFKNVSDFKSILDILNPLIENIKQQCVKLNFKDIKYSSFENNLEIHYNSKLNALLNTLKEQLFGLYDEDIMNKIFGDGSRDVFLDVGIDSKNFNKIYVFNGLPNFMKNLGVGKKVYKKLIKDFNYISSFYAYSPSIDSDLTWNSILNDKEIYSFSNDDNIICFWNEYPYDKIIKKLKKFYKIDGIKQFDDDFLKRYGLIEKEMNMI